MSRTTFGEMPEGFKRAAKEFGSKLFETMKVIHKGNPLLKGGDPVSAGKKPKPKC